MLNGENEIKETVAEEIKETETDNVHISPDVIAIVAGLAASDIKGVAGMSGGIVGGIAEKLGRKDLSKGVKVYLEEDNIKINLDIIIEFGVQIVEVANKLKQEVRNAVEKFTGLKVSVINVNVLAINIPKEQEDKNLEQENV
ncbi:MAG: Asp23/Gls24 family envelope stress response protein [Desulfotomaculaceae bacterium]